MRPQAFSTAAPASAAPTSTAAAGALAPSALRRAAAPPATRAICGVAVADMAEDEALSLLFAHLREKRFLRVAFLNAHCANVAVERPDYGAALGQFLVLPDGVGVDLAARLLHGRPFAANLNGTDLVPTILAAAPTPLKVALFGAAPGVVEVAAQKLAERYPRHDFVAVSHGYLPEAADRAAALARLEETRADVVLLGMGVPVQELFALDHLDARHGCLVLAVGALLDFSAGRVKRAPRVLRTLRVEWLWRLVLEPRRLFRRYVLGNPVFIARTLRDALLRKVTSP